MFHFVRVIFGGSIDCISSSLQGSHYRLGESPLMAIEMVLMYVEVIYLWRALPFCGDQVKQQLLDELLAPLPAEAQPVHHALRAWLCGGLLNSMGKPVEAEKVSRATSESKMECIRQLLSFECVVFKASA